MEWRDQLQSLIGSGSYRTQAALVRALKSRGHDVTQATVSRELTAQGIRKVGGVYRTQDGEVPAEVYGIEWTAGGCLGVVHTDPGFASILGLFIDRAEIEGVIGTVSGDDTVFVAANGAPEVVEGLAELLSAADRR